MFGWFLDPMEAYDRPGLKKEIYWARVVKEIFRIIYLIGKIHYDPIVLYYFGLRAEIMIFQESQDGDFGGNSRFTMTQLYYIFLV